MASFIYRLLWLSCGIVSPVYRSYKTIKDRNVKEYVRLMMHWVVFAIFSFAEVFTDFFLSWLPFYFEVKVVMLLWLVLPATRGSTVVYTRYIHPLLLSRENEIDSYVKKLKDHFFDSLVFLGSKGLCMFTDLLTTVTIKGQAKLASHLRSVSLSDLSVVGTDALQRSESFQETSSCSRTRSQTKRRLLRYKTISSPTNRSEMESIVGSENRFHDDVKSSRMSVLEEDLISNSEHESASEAFPLMELSNKEPTDLIAGSEFNPIKQCPSSPLVDKASGFLHDDLTLNFTSTPQSQNVVCDSVNDERSDVTPQAGKEISSAKEVSSLHCNETNRSPTQIKPSPSLNETLSSTIEECSQIAEVEFPKQHPSDILNQSSFEATPSFCPEASLLQKSTSRPSTKSSGFTKTNFLRSLKFFDAKGSKSIKTLDNKPQPK